MRHIVEKLHVLKTTSSSLEKIELLKEYLQEEGFRIVVEMTLDETMHYNIKKLPVVKVKKIDPTFDDLISFLHFLASKQGANNEEKKHLASFCIDKDWETIIQIIISKDLKCGIGAKLINTASPGSILTFPYCGCSTSKKFSNIVYPAICQIKEDGLFDNIFHSQNTVKHFTRNGNELIFPESSLNDEIMRYFPRPEESLVYMGELRVQIDGRYLPRKTSNGIVSKALKKNGTISTGESRKIHFICWDVITQKEFWDNYSNENYADRFDRLSFLEFGSEKFKRCHLVETKLINSKVEAQDWSIQVIADGGEGTITKNFDAKWNDTHRTDQIKLKAGDLGVDNERECELKVIDWGYGKERTKFENCLGKLVCVSADNLLEVNVSGFKESERGFFGWADDGITPVIVPDFVSWVRETYLNKIVTVRFNEVIKAKNLDKHSLFSPRFMEIRHDKNTADTLDYIKEL